MTQRVLVTIPHYFRREKRESTGRRHGSQTASRQFRSEALRACVGSLHQQMGGSQSFIHLGERRTGPANRRIRAQIDVAICTVGDDHLVDEIDLSSALFQHVPCRIDDSMLLGYGCHDVLRERYGHYDYYCYLEDDLVLHDPWLFQKLAWFNRQTGNGSLLQPNRFERSFHDRDHKVYIDGGLSPGVTAEFQDVTQSRRLTGQVLGNRVIFQRCRNPHSGCFFLNAEQMQTWIHQPFFGDRSQAFVGPLESAATLGIMRSFLVYKPIPQNANFLEIEHFGDAFASLIRYPNADA